MVNMKGTPSHLQHKYVVEMVMIITMVMVMVVVMYDESDSAGMMDMMLTLSYRQSGTRTACVPYSGV